MSDAPDRAKVTVRDSGVRTVSVADIPEEQSRSRSNPRDGQARLGSEAKVGFHMIQVGTT